MAVADYKPHYFILSAA